MLLIRVLIRVDCEQIHWNDWALVLMSWPYTQDSSLAMTFLSKSGS